MKQRVVCPRCGDEIKEEVALCPEDRSPLVLLDPDDPYAGRLLERRYRLLERIGEGGVGAVYRALHLEMRKVVAIKILHQEYVDHPEFSGRFRREARAASRLGHPHIVVVTDFGTADDISYLVMEHLEGKSLSRILETEKPLPAFRAGSIFDQVLAALGHAHERGVIHRDVKSANVFLTHPIEARAEHGKLLDFGFAKITRTSARSDTTLITQPGIVFGTPAYISPEQGSGGSVDERTDLYAAGVLAFEMFVGQRPFAAESAAELILQHVHDEPPRPRALRPELSPELEGLLLTALAKRPEARFPSADTLRHALRRTPEWSAVKEIIAPPPGPAKAFPQSPVLPPAPPSLEDLPTVPRAIPALPEAPPKRAKAKEGSVPPFLKKRSFGVGSAFFGVFLLALLFWLKPWHQKVDAAPEPPPPRPTARAEALLAEGKIEAAEAALKSLVQSTPSSPYAYYLLGNLYISRSWWTDGIDAYENAIAGDASLLRNETLLKNISRALMGRTQERAKALLRRAGPFAVAVLVEATQGPKRQIRAAAIELLEELGEAGRVDRVKVALLDLEETSDCETRKALVARLGASQDERARALLLSLSQNVPKPDPDACLRKTLSEALQKLGAEERGPISN